MPRRVKVRAPRCPHCPYAFVAPAPFRGGEWLLVLVRRRPYRCRSCGERYIGRLFVGHLFGDRIRYLAAWLRDRVL